jgi:hypothetical protein
MQTSSSVVDHLLVRISERPELLREPGEIQLAGAFLQLALLAGSGQLGPITIQPKGEIQNVTVA